MDGCQSIEVYGPDDQGFRSCTRHENCFFPITLRQAIVPTDTRNEWIVGLFAGNDASGE
jgi:hypothetical protein